MTQTPLDIKLNKPNKPNKPKRHPCLITLIVLISIIILLFLICLILAFTLFKPKQPKTTLISATVSGVSPRVTFPAVNIDLNVTVDLLILIQNRNYASFKHGTGKSLLYYRGTQVGDADLFPGEIPARGNGTMAARLTMQADEAAAEMSDLVSDVLGGEFVVEIKSRVPGRVSFLGFIKKHAVAESDCELTIGVPSFKVTNQVCKNKTNL